MADEIRNAFAVAFSDGPTNSPTPVDKAAARQAGATTQQQFDGIGTSIGAVNDRVDGVSNRFDGYDASLTSLQNQISAIDTGSADGIIVEATLANLNARAASLGLTTADAGRGGRVYQDGTAANNGDYRWTGSAWALLGLDRIGKVEAATGAPLADFNGSLIYDYDGVYGAARTMYVPRSVYARIGGTVLNGSYGVASEAFPDSVALTLPGTDLGTIYLDLDDTTSPVKLAYFPNTPPTTKPNKVIVVAEVRLGWVKSPHPVRMLSDKASSRVDVRWPIVAEKDAILIPKVYHYRSDLGFVNYEPTDGSSYWELTRSYSSTALQRVVFDLKAAQAGSNPVSVRTATTAPVVATGNFLVELASLLQGEITTDYPVVGLTQGGSVRNQYRFGRSVEKAQMINGASIADVTEASLINLGFTKGISGASAFFLIPLDEPAPADGFFFARVYVQTNVADKFGQPYINFTTPLGTDLGVKNLFMEKKLSSYAAIYSWFGRYTTAGNQKPEMVYVGVMGSSSTPAIAPIVTGAQVYLGHEDAGWIARDDYPSADDAAILYGSSMFTMTGARSSIFADSIFPDRTSREKWKVAVVSDVPGMPYIRDGDGAIEVETNRLGSAVELNAISSDDPNVRFVRSISVEKAPASKTGSPKVLIIGDSNANRAYVSMTRDNLVALGMTPQMLGTLVNGGAQGEGREGWRWEDITYLNTRFAAVAAGAEATYNSYSSDGNASGATARRDYNPFVRNSVGGDPAGSVFNGKIFDLQFYINRFSLAAPDFVAFILGTNDAASLTDSAVITSINSGLTAIANVRMRYPNAQIGIGIPSSPRGTIEDSKWTRRFVPMIRAVLAYAAASGDTKLSVLPLWAHMSPHVGWPLTTTADANGVIRSIVTDRLHPTDINRKIAASVISNWIACRS